MFVVSVAVGVVGVVDVAVVCCCFLWTLIGVVVAAVVVVALMLMVPTGVEQHLIADVHGLALIKVCFSQTEQDIISEQNVSRRGNITF